MPRESPSPPGFADAVYRSFERLRAAGIIKAYTPDIGGSGVVVWSDDAFVLLRDGRDFATDRELLRAWATGDPAVVRGWLAQEAAAIRARNGRT